MDDPDVPGTFDHWVVFNLPAELRELPEAQQGSVILPSGGVQGVNDFGTLGYRGPCPPSGPAHTYRFFLFAVNKSLDLSGGATKDQVLAAIEGNVLVLQRQFAKWALRTSSWRPAHALDSFVDLPSAKRFPANN